MQRRTSYLAFAALALAVAIAVLVVGREAGAPDRPGAGGAAPPSEASRDRHVETAVATAPQHRAAPRADLPPPPPVAYAPTSIFRQRDVDPSWEAVKLARREAELGPIAAQVAEGLDAARSQMGYCLDAKPFVPWADPYAAHPDENLPDREPAVLVLYLEARDGAIDVVDVTLDSTGAAMPEVIECWAEVLRGHVIPAKDAVPGARYRLRYPIY